jgi:hypothetical protein
MYNERYEDARNLIREDNMKMPGQYVFPDPDDRSKNDPCIIVENKRVLGIYNQAHPDEEDMQKVMPKVQTWFSEKATEKGWDNARFVGGQCILENEFKK